MTLIMLVSVVIHILYTLPIPGTQGISLAREWGERGLVSHETPLFQAPHAKPTKRRLAVDDFKYRKRLNNLSTNPL